MKYSIQFDEATGVIIGAVSFDDNKGSDPLCIEGNNQLILNKYVDISNKAVDPNTLKLIDLDTGDIFNTETNEFGPDPSEYGFWQTIKNFLGL